MEKKQRKRELTFKGIQRFFEILSKIKDEEQIEKFLRDLLSPEEIREIARRMQAAEMLIEGMTYSKINDLTDMSPITIHKANQKIKHGYGGYELLFETIRKPKTRIYQSN